jgi:hypothetical protein
MSAARQAPTLEGTLAPFWRRTKNLLATMAIAIGCLAAAAPLSAATKTTSSFDAALEAATTADCPNQTFTQPFKAWGDMASYTLAPGGSFETSSWALAGNAAIADGNEPFYVAGRRHTRSLALGGGGVATSPLMCVGVRYPTMRFFATNLGDLSSSLKVEVLYTWDGVQRSVLIGSMTGSGSWAPAPAMFMWANYLALFTSGETWIAFRMSVEGQGAWRVDDVFVDPYRAK